jgi:nicotinamide-nucleotide amidase
MISEIIAIGSELLTPYRQDTNSLFLTERLNELGVTVSFKTIVGDRKEHLVGAIRMALQRADIVILMGGLGPTEDDLTRPAVAEALNISLKRDSDLVAELYKRFAARRVTMSANNTQQADVLENAIILDNDRGSAPGQWLDTVFPGKGGEHRKLLALLPGPPHEMKAMYEAKVKPLLKEALPERYIAKRTLKAAMIGESACDARIAPIYKRYTDVETTILAHSGDIQLNLICEKRTAGVAQQRVDELASKIEEELDTIIYSSQGESLEQIVLYYLGMRGLTLATAESCTGGMVAERLTSIPGSSRSYLGGVVVYSDDLKTTLAGVPAPLIAQHGAVSGPVAKSLAEGIRRRTGATYGVSITGVAGPGGGTEEKPVGLVYVAVADEKETEVVEKNLVGDRDRIRHWASQQALDLVRRRLM